MSEILQINGYMSDKTLKCATLINRRSIEIGPGMEAVGPHQARDGENDAGWKVRQGSCEKTLV